MGIIYISGLHVLSLISLRVAWAFLHMYEIHVMRGY